MASQLVEYMKRHKSNSIPVAHNGVCFFDIADSQSMIALTSLNCRPFSTCHECNKGGVIVELFTPGYDGSFYIVSHEHVDPNTDLMTCVNKYAKVNFYNAPKLKPFYAKSGNEMVCWLWRFITTSVNLRTFKSTETDKEKKTLEQIAWTAFKYPKIYANYYVAYEAFLLNRKYLLIDE